MMGHFWYSSTTDGWWQHMMGHFWYSSTTDGSTWCDTSGTAQLLMAAHDVTLLVQLNYSWQHMMWHFWYSSTTDGSTWCDTSGTMFKAKLKSCRSWAKFWEIQTSICKEMCKKLLVLTKSCRSRTDGLALVSNTVRVQVKFNIKFR